MQSGEDALRQVVEVTRDLLNSTASFRDLHQQMQVKATCHYKGLVDE